MMDDTTVQTTPEPSQTRESIRLPKSVTTLIESMGIEVTTVAPERPIPDDWSQVEYRIPLHPNGEVCPHTGTCATATIATVRRDEEGHRGEWAWFGGHHCLVGWRRTGPNAEELKLKEIHDDLKEDLGNEEYMHSCTRADLTASQEQRGKIRASLRRWRKEANDAEHRYGIALQAAWAGWSVAIILAAYLIESVI